MFPNGWPGKGLLLLRLTDGLLLSYGCIVNRHGYVHHVAGSLLAISAITAVLLSVGLWTPIAGILSAASVVPLFVHGSDDPRILICLMVFGISVSMLGPGAFSIDALIFGRRRLDLPDH